MLTIMEIKEDITGQDLKLWRKESKLTQPQAARILGYTKRQLQKWENNESPIRQGIKWACYGYAVAHNITTELFKRRK
jgi:DNA-binding transcriptional regulator YiaG